MDVSLTQCIINYYNILSQVPVQMQHYDSPLTSVLDAQAVSNAHFGQGTGPMILDNVFCRGTENNIQNCYKSFDASEDSHNEDAGVICVKQGTDVVACNTKLRQGTDYLKLRLPL